ncbi:transposase [Kitasatospora sp. NBC_01266]|uniref:transposase n=1 Tax=Kitasatospora sp. NBC_01266 TaxID=2903572 RepID=UPI003FA5E0C8
MGGWGTRTRLRSWCTWCQLGRTPGGIPLHVITTAANVNDVTQTLALVDGVPPVTGRVGHPRKRPDALLGDKGYDSNPNRRELYKRGILPVISARADPTSRAWASSATWWSRPSPCSTSSAPGRPLGTPPRPPQRPRVLGLLTDLPAPPQEGCHVIALRAHRNRFRGRARARTRSSAGRRSRLPESLQE